MLYNVFLSLPQSLHVYLLHQKLPRNSAAVHKLLRQNMKIFGHSRKRSPDDLHHTVKLPYSTEQDSSRASGTTETGLHACHLKTSPSHYKNKHLNHLTHFSDWEMKYSPWSSPGELCKTTNTQLEKCFQAGALPCHLFIMYKKSKKKTA